MGKCEVCAQRSVVVRGVRVQSDSCNALVFAAVMCAFGLLDHARRGGWHVLSLSEVIGVLVSAGVGAALYYVLMSRVQHAMHKGRELPRQ